MSTRGTIPVRIGDTLGGKYRLERVIGQGGMGIVYAARHTELERRVAVKVLLPDAANREQVERFMREARAAGRLKSDHAVRVTDVGRLKGGTPFMVMDLLEGEDLAQLVDRGPVPVATAVDFILQACEAIAEAHALGMVHRDIKPSNLYLVRGVHGAPVVKVLDFGLAKHRAIAADSLTKTSMVMGSPPYMSPEQLKSMRNVDARTDIWSLGVTLYQLITSKLPFEAPTVPEVCALILMGSPAPPTLPHVPEGLWLVIERCVAKDPGSRFQSVWELAHVLESFAAPTSRGSADRVAHVLRTTSLASSHPPPAATPAGIAGTDTAPAASFDSSAHDRKPGRLPVVLGVSALVAIAAVASLAVVVTQRSAPASSSALYAAPMLTASSVVITPTPAAPATSAPADTAVPLEASGDAGMAAAPRASAPALRPATTRPKPQPPYPEKNPSSRF